MPTNKKRVNLTLPKREYDAIDLMATNSNKSRSAVILNLIQEKFELEEDKYLAEMAIEREKDGGPYYSHKEAWGKNV